MEPFAPADRLADGLRIYVEQIHPCFSRIQASAARLAGLLVQTEIASSRHALDIESRLIGLSDFEEARDDFRRFNPRKVDEHFHHHLGLAVDQLGAAWEAADQRRAGLIAAADPLPRLQGAWRELKVASRILPGFETVDYRNSCCALHAGNAPARH